MEFEIKVQIANNDQVQDNKKKRGVEKASLESEYETKRIKIVKNKIEEFEALIPAAKKFIFGGFFTSFFNTTK